MCSHLCGNRPLWRWKCKSCILSWYAFQYIIPKAVSHVSLLSEVYLDWILMHLNIFQKGLRSKVSLAQNIFHPQNIYYCLLFLTWAPEKIRLFVLDRTKTHNKRADCFTFLQFKYCQCALFWYIGSWENYTVYFITLKFFFCFWWNCVLGSFSGWEPFT